MPLVVWFALISVLFSMRPVNLDQILPCPLIPL